MQRIQLDNSAAKAVDAYIEYHNIVGNADGGKLLTDHEYEEFKRNAGQQRAKRLFVYWTNLNGIECKAVGPDSRCFCNHKYRDHHTESLSGKVVVCKTPKCPCKHFNYVPVYGSNDLKCLCKHSYIEHHAHSRKCIKPNCACRGFTSSHSCSCMLNYAQHETRFYTKDERVAMGKPVNSIGGGDMYAGLGGLTDLVSLTDGVEREQMVHYSNQQALTGQSRMAIEGPRSRQAVDTQLVRKKERMSGLDLFNRPHKYR